MRIDPQMSKSIRSLYKEQTPRTTSLIDGVENNISDKMTITRITFTTRTKIKLHHFSVLVLSMNPTLIDWLQRRPTVLSR